VSLASPAPSAAQPYVGAPCAADAPPRFVDQLQPLWYRRFWTGECDGLPRRCRSGKPYWNDVVRTLVARAAPAQRSEVAERACRLGRQIGLEWTKPNAERRIDTGDLRALDATLERSPDVVTGLAAVEAKVRGRVAL
jgi:hypothetical protein